MASVPSEPVIPSITGYPQLDSLIRSALLSAAAALTAVIVTWLNAHGFTDPNLSVMIGGAILSLLGAVVIAGWGFLQAQWSKRVVSVATTSGVRAGAALALSGNLITQQTVSGETVVAPITPASAVQIVKDYAPAPKVT